MKTQLTKLRNGSRNCAKIGPVPGIKPVFALVMRLLLAFVLVLPIFGAQAGVVLTTLNSFADTNDGANPNGLVQGNDGNFYGTTYEGGTNGLGTVFKISTNGALTTLYSFGSLQDTDGDPLDGANPVAALLQGNDGYFYGTTFSGGTNYYAGTVFKISPNGALTTLYSFGSVQDTNGNLLDGYYPNAGLVQGSDGNFYGTTIWGGTNVYGTLFKINNNGMLTTLHSFTSGNDGGNPRGALVQGSDGFFYGTTTWGGTNGYYGTVFKVSTNGALNTLYSFGSVRATNDPLSSLDGGNPNGLVQGSDGIFYGTTGGMGREGFGWPFSPGTVFKLTTNGVLTTLHSFSAFSGGNDGANPVAALVQGNDGNFYGTTECNVFEPGDNSYGPGTVFQISANGGLTTVHAFGSITNANGEPLDGANPAAALVQGSDGNFYGTTSDGGPNGAGTIFRLTIVPEPQLTIIPYGENVILTWPTNAFVFTLQSSMNLGSSAIWTTNFPAPVLIGGQNVVINPITGSQMFYRLLLAP